MNALQHAAKVLEEGGIIAYPTEAVFGLGCNPKDGQAVRRLLAIKQRPIEKGLILIAGNVAQLAAYVPSANFEQYPHVLESWPGPHTWIMPCNTNTPIWLKGQYHSLAVRVTAHRQTAELCQLFGGAIVSTSANLSNTPPAATANDVKLALGKYIDYILDGPTSGLAEVSTIRDAVSGEQLR